MIWNRVEVLLGFMLHLNDYNTVSSSFFQEKCTQYWPHDNEAVYYGDLQVSMRSESVLDNYTIRIFDIQLVSGRCSFGQ